MTTDTRTPEQIAQHDRLMREACTNVMQGLSAKSLPPRHTFPQTPHGVYVTTNVYPNGELKVYALPWARGWAIFADATSKYEVRAGSWSSVRPDLFALQRPLYCKRGESGAWNVPSYDVVKAVADIIEIIQKMNIAKHNEARNKVWYWPSHLVKELS